MIKVSLGALTGVRPLLAGLLHIDLIKDMGAHLFLRYYKPQGGHHHRQEEKWRKETRREDNLM